MRLYCFTNSNFIKEIQNGIQTAHIVSELFCSYTEYTVEKRILFEWAKNHKTAIVLKGGNHLDLEALYQELLPFNLLLGLPVTIFHEDATQNFVCTAVGIIVPESIYDMDPLTNPKNTPENLQVEAYTPEWQLFDIIKSKSLA